MPKTPLKRARRRRHERERTHAVLDSLAASVIVCDASTHIIYANAAAQRSFAGSAASLVGSSLPQILPELDGVLGAVSAGTSVKVPFTRHDQRLIATCTVRQDLGNDFIIAVDEVYEEVVADDPVQQWAAELSSGSEQVKSHTNHVDAASRDVSDRSVAAKEGFEYLMELMNGVAEGADMIRTSTLAVVDSANAATESVSELGTSTSKIGEFTATITSIAQQTKLLALNATIEATRAGAAGSGFAVVAQEVKQLAERASAATDQVSAIIETLQATSRAVTVALQAIVDGVDTVGEQQLTVNQIVDKQVVQVDIIATSLAELVDSTEQLTECVAGAQQSAASLAQQTA